jgi:hypothetical protein
MFRVRLPVKTSNIVGNTGSLTLNFYLEVQTGVSYYVTSFYRMTYPEHLPGSPDWCFLLWY